MIISHSFQQQQQKDNTTTTTTTTTTNDEENSLKTRHNTHWQLSSSLTTQHLISIVAVCNTLMSMNYAKLNKQGTSMVLIDN